MDLRVEASYTNLSRLDSDYGGGFFYWNTRYEDGYTNQGNIIGNGTVAAGDCLPGESTYCFASDKTVQFATGPWPPILPLPREGAFRTPICVSEWNLIRHVASSFVQYEWWNFPG